MKIVFDPEAWDEYEEWLAEDMKTARRIHDLIKECRRNHFVGRGKPEPLKRNLSGWWSRRIDHEHRLVYRVTGKGDTQALEILSCRYHY